MTEPRKPPDGRPAGPAHRICTQRLVIRSWQTGDANVLTEAILASLAELRLWMPWAHREPVALQVRVERLRQFRDAFDTGRDFPYGLFDAHETMVPGAAGLHTRLGPGAREIGFWIRSDHTRHGYATEAATALAEVALTVDRVGRVEIRCDPANVASARVARKAGCIYRHTLQANSPGVDGTLRDTDVWRLTAAQLSAAGRKAPPLSAFGAHGQRLR